MRNAVAFLALLALPAQAEEFQLDPAMEAAGTTIGAPAAPRRVVKAAPAPAPSAPPIQAASTAAISPATPPATPPDLPEFLIVPGERAGLVTADLTSEELAAQLPETAFRHAPLPIGEGAYRCGTILYPGTDKELRIFWKSEQQPLVQARDLPMETIREECAGRGYFQFPQWVEIGLLNAKKDHAYSPWHLANGMRLGLGLAEMEALNGAPFKVETCDCDAGGNVHKGWENGDMPYELSVHVNYDRREKNRLGLPSVESGGTRSDDPALRTLAPYADLMRVEF